MIEILKTLIPASIDYNNLKGVITFINPYSYLLMRKNKGILSKMDAIYVDGISLVLLLRLVGIKTRRLSFDLTSVAPKIFEKYSENNKRVYFIGSKKKEIKRAIANIKQQYPQLNIISFRNGYFKSEDEKNNTTSEILALKIDLVIVGMGTPHQELFLVKLKEKGYQGVAFSCGGFLHQTINKGDYYPSFFNIFNIRWIYRMIDEPKLIPRYFIDYPKSLILFVIDFIKYKLKLI